MADFEVNSQNFFADFDDSRSAVSRHYPYIDQDSGNWMSWDVKKGKYLDTGVHAKGDKGVKGDTGKGIAYTTLNPDYTLTIYYDDGTSWNTPSIRGAKGDKGDIGDVNYSTFAIDPTTGILSATYSRENEDITFALNNGHLEVSFA